MWLDFAQFGPLTFNSNLKVKFEIVFLTALPCHQLKKKITYNVCSIYLCNGLLPLYGSILFLADTVMVPGGLGLATIRQSLISCVTSVAVGQLLFWVGHSKSLADLLHL